MVEIPAYGSFTGQDIKAVVHIPTNMESANKIIEDLQRSRENLTNDLNKLGSIDISGSIESQILRSKQNQNARAGIERELEAINSKITEYQNFINSGTLPVKVLAELSTISYSIHREKFPVRALGSVYPKGFTKGPRTIAGSLVFTVFNKHVLDEFLNATTAVISTGVTGSDIDQHNAISPALSDQIPPFDITVTYNNEHGESAKMVIYGVEIVNEGQVTSVNDMITENEMQYVARDIDLMTNLTKRNLISSPGGIRSKTPKDVANNDEAFQKLIKRRNPFA
jgi:hypothetical protein